MYNLTNITNANNVLDIITATNNLSQGVLFAMVMPVLFFAFLVVFKGRDFKKVLLADCFFMVIISGMAWSFEWVGWTFVIVPVVLFVGALIAYQFMD